jgi:hypothetical protein
VFRAMERARSHREVFPQCLGGDPASVFALLLFVLWGHIVLVAGVWLGCSAVARGIERIVQGTGRPEHETWLTARLELAPGNKQLARILAVTGPSLLESLQGGADHKMSPGLVKALGLKGTFGVYYGEYGFKNKAKAKQEIGDFFARLEDPGE